MSILGDTPEDMSFHVLEMVAADPHRPDWVRRECRAEMRRRCEADSE